MAGSPDKIDDRILAEHVATWATFQRLAKWTIALCVILLIGMAAFLTGGHNVIR
jgi:hypothetical protein